MVVLLHEPKEWFIGLNDGLVVYNKKEDFSMIIVKETLDS